MKLWKRLVARIPRRYYYVTWEGQRSYLGDRSEIEEECRLILADEPDAVLSVSVYWTTPAALDGLGEWMGW